MRIAMPLPLLLVLVAGCAQTGAITLIPRDGGERALGSFSTGTRAMEVTLAGKRYSGGYVTNASRSVSTGQAFAGGTTAFGSSQTVNSGNSGIAMLSAPDGDTIRCEFNYQGLTGIGTCQTRAGRVFDLTTQ